MASRFWVGGTGTWDAATTTHWAASSGGAGGQSVPGSSDTVTFDGSSGGGTVTLNFGGTITVQSLTMGAFTGTWDNSVNNNNITVSTSSGISISGTATRTINLGSATYTLSAGSGATWGASTVTGLTFSGGSSTITFTAATSGQASFQGGGLTYGTVNFGAVSSSGRYLISTGNTFGHLNITAPNAVAFPSGVTTTISNSFSWSGSSGSEIMILSNNFGSTATVAAAASSTVSWGAFRDMTFTGAPTATNSFDLSNNSGITIGAPIASGSGSGVIGS